jgi:hypothetical protein
MSDAVSVLTGDPHVDRELRAAADLRAAFAEEFADDELMLDTIDGETSLLDLLDEIEAALARSESDALYLAQRIEQMQARKARLEQTAKRAKHIIAKALRGAGLKGPIRRPAYTVSLRDGGVRVRVVSPELVPDHWMVHKPAPPPTPNLTAIKAAFDADVSVPGCELERGEPVAVILRK